MVKDLKGGWELLNDKQNFVVKSFRGAKRSPMRWHAKPNIEKNPENIIHSGTNDISRDANPEKIAVDIINLSRPVSEESGINVIIPGLVPRKGYVNAKEKNVNNRLRHYC